MRTYNLLLMCNQMGHTHTSDPQQAALGMAVLASVGLRAIALLHLHVSVSHTLLCTCARLLDPAQAQQQAQAQADVAAPGAKWNIDLLQEDVDDLNLDDAPLVFDAGEEEAGVDETPTAFGSFSPTTPAAGGLAAPQAQPIVVGDLLLDDGPAGSAGPFQESMMLASRGNSPTFEDS